MMRDIFPRIYGAITIAVATSTAQAQFSGRQSDGPWSVSVGGGVGVSPLYMGGAKLRANPLPNLSVAYKTEDLGNFALGGGGLQWTPIQTPIYSLGLGLGYDAGRRETTVGLGSKRDIPKLKGMGRIPGSAVLGGFGSLSIAGGSLTAALFKGASNGHGGVYGGLGFEMPFRFGKFDIAVTPGFKFGNASYTQAYFGVTAAQSLSSGLPKYTTGSGITSYGLAVSVRYPLTKNWSLQARAGADRLAGEFAKSPIVERKVQPNAGLMVGYTF